MTHSRRPHVLVRRGAGLCLAAWLLGAVPAAAAGTGPLLPFPPRYGDFPASTYDSEGDRIGGSHLSLVRRPDGQVDVDVLAQIDSGGSNHASAMLRPAPDGRGLVIVTERSESHDEQGRPLGVMQIDHDRGVATCSPPEGSDEKAERVSLPEGERVVNVPLNLLFLPLVRGESQEVAFQFFLCRGGARLMDFHARLAGSTDGGNGRRIIEVSYGPDLGGMVSWIARRLVPKLSFWFEADEDGTYLAHRMPLFTKGPEVVVVRDGMASGELFSGP